MSLNDQKIRRLVRASKGAAVRDAVSQFIKLSFDKEIERDYTGSIQIARGGDIEKFASLFAQGVQYINEQFPHVHGPDAIIFGFNGSNIGYKGQFHPVTTSFARPIDSNDNGFIMVALQDVAERMDMVRFGKKGIPIFESRKVLGELSGEEAIFLDGVEEAYHAVQHQDQKIKEKYKNITPEEGLRMNHDTNPRELDVVPIMQQALAEFRKRRGMGVG